MRMFEKVEVPFYLLVIGLFALEKGNTGLATLMFLISFFRLWINSMKDEDNKSNSEGDL